MLSHLYLRSTEALGWILSVLGSAIYKFYWDDGLSRASALAYTTLFALVPLTALSVSFFGMFGVDQQGISESLHKILAQILPPIDNEQLQVLQLQVFESLTSLGGSIRALNVVSIAALVITSIAFLNTIESALNVVWRASSELSLVSKIVNFWAVLTLGTLLIAVSFYYTAQVASIAQSAPFVQMSLHYLLDFVVPVAITWAALTMLYYKLPSAKVLLHEAAFGGLIAAVLFEIAKRIFAYYVGLSAGYSRLYGVLATVPLFLFWLYVTWVVVLLGAQVSYQAGSIKILRGRQKYATDLGEIGAILGLRILYSIGKRFIAGQLPPTEAEIAIETGSDPVLLRACLNVLSQANVVTISDTETHARTLLVHPEKLRIADVLHIFYSKRQRAHLAREGGGKNGDGGAYGNSEEDSFLQLLANAQAKGAPKGSIVSWSLAELIGKVNS